MILHHDSRCDRRHTSRQRCNRALGPQTPADDRLARLAAEAPVAEPPAPPAPIAVEVEPEPEPRRLDEALATAGLSVLPVSADEASETEPGLVYEADATADVPTAAPAEEPEEELEPGLFLEDVAMADLSVLPAAPAEAPEPEPEPSLMREVLATTDAPTPTVFVSREWDSTAEAVEQAYRPPDRPATRAVPQPDSSRTAALIGLALAAILFVLFARGHGSHPAER